MGIFGIASHTGSRRAASIEHRRERVKGDRVGTDVMASIDLKNVGVDPEGWLGGVEGCGVTEGAGGGGTAG